jgi:transcriptional regulator with XRE-family HTH domain
MGGRSLTPEENARVVEAVRELLRRGETQTSIALAVKGKQSTISSLMAGNHRAGYGFARNLAAAMGVPLDELLRGRPGSHGAQHWRDWSEWPELERRARELFPRVDEAAWRWLGSLGGVDPPLDPVTLGNIALAWSNRPLPVPEAPPRRPVTPRVLEHDEEAPPEESHQRRKFLPPPKTGT